MADIEGEVKPLPSTSTSTSPNVPPSSTVYINNLNETVGLDVLKQSLSALFSTYGTVLSITAHGNLRMRGQAFVAFDDGEVASKAIKEVNGFPLYGKPMQLSFAKTPSDSVVIKSTGSTTTPEYQSHKEARLARKAAASEKRKEQQRAARRSTSGTKRKRTGDGDDDEEDSSHAQKKAIPQMPDEYLPPNPILFIQNIPSGETTRSQLETLFGQFPNMLDVRTIPNNDAIAFVEFASAEDSARARDAFNGTRLSGQTKDARGIRVTFARG